MRRAHPSPTSKGGRGGGRTRRGQSADSSDEPAVAPGCCCAHGHTRGTGAPRAGLGKGVGTRVSSVTPPFDRENLQKTAPSQLLGTVGGSIKWCSRHGKQDDRNNDHMIQQVRLWVYARKNRKQGLGEIFAHLYSQEYQSQQNVIPPFNTVLALKRKEILTHDTTRMSLEDSMLSEMSQSQKNKDCRSPLYMRYLT